MGGCQLRAAVRPVPCNPPRVAWRRYVVALVALAAGMALGWGVHQPLPFGPLPKMSDIGPGAVRTGVMTLVALAWWRHRPTVRWPVTLAAVLLVTPYER